MVAAVNGEALIDMDAAARGLAFPEGPVALADGTVLVVEIAGGRLSKIGGDGTVTMVAEVGGGPSGSRGNLARQHERNK